MLTKIKEYSFYIFVGFPCALLYLIISGIVICIPKEYAKKHVDPWILRIFGGRK